VIQSGSTPTQNPNPNPNPRVRTKEGRTYPDSPPCVTTAVARVESRHRAGRMGRATARRSITGARAQDADTGPLDGGALTHWGARAPTRGPAAAPVRSRVLGASHRSACGDQGTVVQIARRWRAHPWGMRAPARGPTTTPSPLFALALSLATAALREEMEGVEMR